MTTMRSSYLYNAYMYIDTAGSLYRQDRLFCYNRPLPADHINSLMPNDTKGRHVQNLIDFDLGIELSPVRQKTLYREKVNLLSAQTAR